MGLRRWALAPALVVVLSIGAIARAASVTPETREDFESGNAATECAAVGDYDHAFKIDNWNGGIGGACATGQADGNVITIANNDCYSFDWSSLYGIGAVIVKGGPVANVFYYGSASGDTDLCAPLNPNTPAEDDTYGVSHVSFCWNGEVEELCPEIGPPTGVPLGILGFIQVPEPSELCGHIIVDKVAANAPLGHQFEFDPPWVTTPSRPISSRRIRVRCSRVSTRCPRSWRPGSSWGERSAATDRIPGPSA